MFCSTVPGEIATLPSEIATVPGGIAMKLFEFCCIPQTVGHFPSQKQTVWMAELHSTVLP